MRSICYVDDDEAEIGRFRKTFREIYIIGAGTTFDAAIKDLKEKHVSRPDLILLDLYFGPKPDEEKRQKMLKADAELAKKEHEVRTLLFASGQTPEGGFKLADDAAKLFPRVPRAFFSRRAYLEDAMRAHDEGLKLLEKADPGEDGDYDKALEANKDTIKSKIDRIIYRNSFWVRNRQRVEGFIVGILAAVAKFGWDVLTGSHPHQ
jgi:hypothetical protein